MKPLLSAIFIARLLVLHFHHTRHIVCRCMFGGHRKNRHSCLPQLMFGGHADLATKVQRKHHEDMVNALMHLMRPEQEPRVQAHAASAVVNFCEGLDENSGSNIVGRYIKPLSGHLVVLLQSSNQLVVEGALTATSSIADSAGVLPLSVSFQAATALLLCVRAIRVCTVGARLVLTWW